MRRPVLILFVMLSLVGGASSQRAFAQGPPLRAAGNAAAQPLETDPHLGPLFARGVDALLGQRFDEALGVFENLYRQAPRPTLLYYLGKVALAQQRYAAAADLYRRFVKGSGEEIDADTRLEVTQFLTSTQAPECEVTVQGEPGAILLADGRVAGSLPLEQPLGLSPGAHKLTLEKGRRKVETQVTLAARRRAEVRFTMIPPLALLTLTPGVVLVMQMEPRSLEPTLGPQLQNTMLSALAQQNAVLIMPDAQAELLARAPELSGCLHQISCQEKLGQMASAQFVLHLSVQSEAGQPGRPADKNGHFRFTAKLLDTDVGMISVQATQSCADCSLKAALAQLGDTVQELLRQAAARPRGTLQVESDPPGALVQFDGHTLGTTPYRREAFVGPHEVMISKVGYTSHSASINITETEPTQLSVALPQMAVAQQTSSRGKRIAKWSLLGGGALLTVIGAAILGAKAGPGEGKSAGVPLLVLGIGAMGTGGVLFLLDRPSASSSTGPGSTTSPSGPAPAQTLALPLLGF